MKIAEMLMLYLTYEELKPLYFSPFSFTIYVVPYLWGIETPNTFSRITVAITSLYLTYEELKHVSFLFTNSLCPPCCTLPMRNWNRFLFHFSPVTLLSVVPYLWGIETLSLSLSLSFFNLHVVPYLWGIETCALLS